MTLFKIIVSTSLARVIRARICCNYYFIKVLKIEGDCLRLGRSSFKNGRGKIIKEKCESLGGGGGGAERERERERGGGGGGR